MAQSPRIDFIRYYHVINLGVEKRVIFLENDDFTYFLALIDELKIFYQFHLHAYCLMSNHYHLLIETTRENLSLILKQINQRYTLYFNKKYNRTGTLWKGRFKSWYVHDEHYCKVLHKYIENNPIKARLSTAVGQYPWARVTTKESPLTSNELERLTQYQKEKISIMNQAIVHQKKAKPLYEHFLSSKRNKAIMSAIEDGYSQSAVASYLKLSTVAISKLKKLKNKKRSFLTDSATKKFFGVIPLMQN